MCGERQREIENLRPYADESEANLDQTSLREAAKISQSDDEEADFLTSLGSLRPKFAAAVLNMEPGPDQTPPERPKPSHPSISA